MYRQKLPQLLTGVKVITLLLVGCGSPAAISTPIPPTSTPTAKPPTTTPTQGITLATSVDEIVGTWQKINGAGYIRFYEEGTFHQARTLEDIESNPFAICEIWFERTQMFIGECKVSGVPPCGDAETIYEVQLLQDDRIEIASIEDSCSPRRRDTATIYKAVR